MTAAPHAERRPTTAMHHGITLTDDYAWLRDPGYPEVTDPDVLAHLTVENAHFEAWLAPHAALVDTLFDEMKGRIKEDEASVPAKDGNWLYWRAYETGGQYRKWWRRPVAGGEDQLILDEPALAAGKEYFRLGAIAVSEDARFLAYATDDDGSERFTARIRDLTTGQDLSDALPDTMGALVWSADGSVLIYGRVNDQWRIVFRWTHAGPVDVANLDYH